MPVFDCAYSLSHTLGSLFKDIEPFYLHLYGFPLPHTTTAGTVKKNKSHSEVFAMEDPILENHTSDPISPNELQSRLLKSVHSA